MAWFDWPKSQYTMLASYVLPQLADRLKLAIVRDDALAKSDGPRIVAGAIYDALITDDIRYAREIYDPEIKRQKIRDPYLILGGSGDGTCLDLALLFAGLCLGNELLPLVVVMEGHAFVAVATKYGRRDASIINRRADHGAWVQDGLLTSKDNGSRTLCDLVAKGDYFAVECTGFAKTQTISETVPEGVGRTNGLLSYDKATEAGKNQLAYSRPFLFAIDPAVLQDVLLVEPFVAPTRDTSAIVVSTRISDERSEALSVELGITHSALDNFFKIIDRKNVPVKDLDATLREIATHVKGVSRKLEQRNSGDNQIEVLRRGARQALDAEQFELAESLLIQASERDVTALQQAKSAIAERTYSAAESNAEIGELKYAQLAHAEAAGYYRRAAELVDGLPGGNQLALAEYLNMWGRSEYEAGNFREAEQPFTRALQIRDTLGGDDDLGLAVSLNNMAAICRARGGYNDAERLARRALAIRERLLDSNDPMIALSCNALAGICKVLRHFDEAENLYKRALAINEAALGPQHLQVGITVDNFAELYRVQSRFMEAEPLFKRALEIIGRTLGPNARDLAITLSNLGLLYTMTERNQLAEPLLRRAVSVAETSYPAGHRQIAVCLDNLGLLYEREKRYSEAAVYYERATPIFENEFGAGKIDVAENWFRRSAAYEGLKRYGDAAAAYERALATLETAESRNPEGLIVNLNTLMHLYVLDKNYAKAEAPLRRAIPLAEKHYKTEPQHIATLLENLSEVVLAQGRIAEAQRLFERARSISREAR
jgi:hypothetical protein